MKTPTALSVTSSQREQTSLRSQAPRLPRSNVCSTPDLENPSASVHRKRFSTPSLTLKFLCAGKLNPPVVNRRPQSGNRTECDHRNNSRGLLLVLHEPFEIGCEPRPQPVAQFGWRNIGLRDLS